MEFDTIYMDHFKHDIEYAASIAARSIEHMGSLGLIRYVDGLQIEGADDCPWCLPIMRDIAQIAALSYRGDELKLIGKKLYVLDWDLDRILLSKSDPSASCDVNEDYSIRTWNLAGNGEIVWDFFEIVQDEDGSSHGEAKYYGRSYYHA